MTTVAIEGQLNPFPWYQTMRQSAPVFYNDQRYSWHLFRYDDVQRALSDYTVFSSQFGGPGAAPGGVNDPLAASLISTDPPRHRQLRALVTQAFTPRAVEALAPRIRAIVDELLDNVSAQGHLDVIQDFGYPLPVIVIAELLGIPSRDREQFKRWSDAVVSMGNAGGADGEPYEGDAERDMAHYFLDMIEERRRQPGPDLISGLLAANIDGQRLTLPELLGFGSLLLVAGNETTTNLLGNALMTFTGLPEVWERLRREPALVPEAIEEVLRYRSPVQSMFRVTKAPVELSGQQVPAGARVVAWIGSANHDEAQFTDPEHFMLGRSPNRHLAFGNGIHYCLGAPLARLEAKIALTAMLQRFRTVERIPGAPLERLPSMILYGVRSLPIKFTLA
jgi:cytochrome P450